MTTTLTALENTKARLIAKEARISHCADTVELVKAAWEAQGFIVIVRTED